MKKRLLMSLGFAAVLTVALFGLAIACEWPQVWDGNPTCKDVLGPAGVGIKFDPPTSGAKSAVIYGKLVTVTLTVQNGVVFSWASSHPVEAEIAKGGTKANVWKYYDTLVYSATGHTAPINSNTGKPYGLSHVDFCWSTPPTAVHITSLTAERRWPNVIELLHRFGF